MGVRGVAGDSASTGSGEKSTRSSKVKTGGGGGSDSAAKFSRHREEAAAACPGVANLPPAPERLKEIGEARSR